MLQQTPSEPISGNEVAPTQVRAPQAVSVDPGLRAGQKLAQARLQRGWSLDEVGERIRVRREFLEALEDMNIKLLPGKAYAIAFLKSYARELGLDEKAIVDQFQIESALVRQDAQKQLRNPASKPHRERPWMAAALLVGLAAAFVVWRALPSKPETQAQAEISPSGQSPSAITPNAETSRRVVEIRAVADAWIEARGPDGTVFLSRTLRAGDVYRPDPSPGWTLHARDGGAFELYVDGVSAGALGAAGMPVLGRPIDGVKPLTQAELAAPRS
ncbi:MAG: helix-turn-helix domain-containing protein [Terricaulis sp.]